MFAGVPSGLNKACTKKHFSQANGVRTTTSVSVCAQIWCSNSSCFHKTHAHIKYTLTKKKQQQHTHAQHNTNDTNQTKPNVRQHLLRWSTIWWIAFNWIAYLCVCVNVYKTRTNEKKQQKNNNDGKVKNEDKKITYTHSMNVWIFVEL